MHWALLHVWGLLGLELLSHILGQLTLVYLYVYGTSQFHTSLSSRVELLHQKVHPLLCGVELPLSVYDLVLCLTKSICCELGLLPPLL